jgi:hypothetical protein
MKTLMRLLRSLNLDSGTHRRRVGECQAGAARLRGAEGTNHALKAAYWTLAVVLALSSSWVHAQTPTCAKLPPPPACNPVTGDGVYNTAMGDAALITLTTGRYNTASQSCGGSVRHSVQGLRAHPGDPISSGWRVIQRSATLSGQRHLDCDHLPRKWLYPADCRGGLQDDPTSSTRLCARSTLAGGR